MGTRNSKWEVARAQAWLHRQGWGEGGAEAGPAPEGATAAATGPGPGHEAPPALQDDAIDIACWPALVAPFYD